MDLNKKHSEGMHINERDLKKHKNDILRLVQLLNPNETIDVNESVKTDMQNFFDLIEKEDINMNALKLDYTKEQAISILKHAFKMD